MSGITLEDLSVLYDLMNQEFGWIMLNQTYEMSYERAQNMHALFFKAAKKYFQDESLSESELLVRFEEESKKALEEKTSFHR